MADQDAPSMSDIAAKMYPTMAKEATTEAPKADDWWARLASQAKDAESQKPNAPAENKPAPADYKDFTLPEGMTVDQDTATSFKAVVKEYGLSQEQAQKLVDMQAQLAAKQSQDLMDKWDKL